MANPTVRTVAATAVSVLFNTGLTVSGYVNPTVAIICWVLMVPVILTAFFWSRIWPWVEKLKRVRLRWPVTLTSTGTSSSPRTSPDARRQHPPPREGGPRVYGPTVTKEGSSDTTTTVQLETEVKQLKAERDALIEEKRQNLQEERRKRVEQWRSVIRNFNFESAERFAGTDSYSQMKPHLKPEVIEMLEAPRTLHVGNEARGDTTYKYVLLDEVARIEKEWGLI